MQMSFGEQLKKARKACKLTQTELGEKIGTDKTAVSRYESNERQPDVKTLKKIAEALDVSPDYLLEAVELSDEQNRQIAITRLNSSLCGINIDGINFITEVAEVVVKQETFKRK